MRWRVTPGFPDNSDYVCMWPQFGAREGDLADGWYFGVPWQSDGVADPRDVYVKLDTIDYGGLLRRYAPVLRFDSEAEYWNASAQTLTDWRDNALVVDNPVAPPPNTPCATDDAVPFRHPQTGPLGWGLDTLVVSPALYPGTDCQSSDRDYIDANGDDKQAADSFRGGPLDNVAYGRAVEDTDGSLWLQYWLFYYRNTQSLAGVGGHQGDWEFVQFKVGGDVDGEPVAATYAQHSDDEADACPYSAVETYPLVEGGEIVREAPLVFVAAGSQASYFGAGTNPRGDLPDDSANGGGLVRNTDPKLVTDVPPWMRWPGRWGENFGNAVGGGASPHSPGEQTSKWDTPSDFHSQAGPCVNPDGSPR